MAETLNFYAPDKRTNASQLPGIYQGSNWAITISNPNADLVLPSSPVPEFKMRLDSGDVIDLSAYANYTADNWPLEVSLPFSVTAGLPPGDYRYDINMYAGECIFVGVLPVTEEVK